MQMTQGQVQAAARAGCAVLDDTDLRVPMQLAVSGALQTLRGILSGVASGALVLVDPKIHEAGLRALEELDRLKAAAESGDSQDEQQSERADAVRASLSPDG